MTFKIFVSLTFYEIFFPTLSKQNVTFFALHLTRAPIIIKPIEDNFRWSCAKQQNTILVNVLDNDTTLY